MSEHDKKPGNPLRVISELRTLVMELHTELLMLEESIFSDSEAKLLRRGVYLKLQEYISDLNPGDAEFLDRSHQVNDLINAIQFESPVTMLEQEPVVMEFQARLNRVVSDAVVLHDRLEERLLEYFNRRMTNLVFSPRAQWAIIVASHRPTQAYIARELKASLDNIPCMNAPRFNQFKEPHIYISDVRRMASIDKSVEAVYRDVLDKLDYADILNRGIINAENRVVLAGASALIAASELSDSLELLRQVLMAIAPDILDQELSDDDEQMLRGVVDLKERLTIIKNNFYGEPDEEGLSVEELNEAIKEGGGVKEVDIGFLERIASLRFTITQDTDQIVADFVEVRTTFEHEAFKLATIGCGMLLEWLLKEALHREDLGLKTIRSDQKLRTRLFKKATYVTLEDVSTWTLFILVEVAAVSLDWMNRELVNRCHHLRKARNKVHGGIVVRDHAVYGLEAIERVFESLHAC